MSLSYSGSAMLFKERVASSLMITSDRSLIACQLSEVLHEQSERRREHEVAHLLLAPVGEPGLVHLHARFLQQRVECLCSVLSAIHRHRDRPRAPDARLLSFRHDLGLGQRLVTDRAFVIENSPIFLPGI